MRRFENAISDLERCDVGAPPAEAGDVPRAFDPRRLHRKPFNAVPSASFSVPMPSGAGIAATNSPKPDGGSAQTSMSIAAPSSATRTRPGPRRRSAAARRSGSGLRLGRSTKMPPRAVSSRLSAMPERCAPRTANPTVPGWRPAGRSVGSGSGHAGRADRHAGLPCSLSASAASRASRPAGAISVTPAGRPSGRNGPGTAMAQRSSRLTKLV